MSERSRTQRDRPVPHQRYYGRDERPHQDSQKRGAPDDRDNEHAQRMTAHDVGSTRHFSDNDAQYQSGHTPQPNSHQPRNDYRLNDERDTRFQHNDNMSPRQDQDYRHDRATTQADAREDVWLREKQSRVTFNDADLEDFSFAKRNNSMATIASYAGIAAMLGVVGLLAFSSLPELSPVDIIEMDGYAGEQTTKTPFNLASMRDCEAGAECAGFSKTTVVPVTTSTSSQPAITTTNATSVAISNTTTMNTTANAGTTADRPIDYIELQEIPAATTVSANTALQPLTTDTTFNDRLVVLQQWSNVRGAPDINSDILTSLAAGKTVTRIGQNGQWLEVRVDERPAVTGYMHRSTVTPQ